jgi:CHAT domain-containing protein
MFSAIELAHGRGDASDNDGHLELHEVLNIRTGSDLVFLSGCESGVGVSWATRFTPGEDYATLARAFLYAGAQNVVSTLWRINDRGASEFAELYYRSLEQGDPVTALAHAQRTALSGTSIRSPHHWAAYVTSGSGGSVSGRN